MSDMSAVIAPKSDQINADDLITGPRTVTIASVKVAPGTEQPVAVSIEGDRKVFRPCKSMMRVMVNAWGPNSAAYAGHSMTLYRDPKVKWGGAEIGGIRISHMTGLDAPMVLALSESKAVRKPFKVLPLQRTTPAASIPRDAAADPPPLDAGQQAGAASTDPAIVWTESLTAMIADCQTRAALAELDSRAKVKLAKRADLLELVQTAVAARNAAFDAADDEPPYYAGEATLVEGDA